MLIGKLAASLLACALAGKPKIPGRGVIRDGEELFDLVKEQ